MIKRIAAGIAVALILATACSKEGPSGEGRDLGQVSVESDGGQITVLVSANGVWKAESSSPWISVDDAWHNGDYTVQVSYASNRSVEGMHRSSRSGRVLIITSDGAQYGFFTINQKGLQL